MVRSTILPLLAAAMIAAVPAAADARTAVSPEQKLAKILEGRVAGEPRDCIPLNATSRTRIINRTAIVYDNGSTIWVNRPTGGEQSLNDSYTMVTKPTGSQLCSIDTVNMVDGSSRTWRGFVQLGKFVPYRKAD